ncbi:MAG: porin family protein [Candidatus Omnitrophica bacterium]|nr:porin family protein [Candidatus Omnitrophota bacterium]MBU4473554.1 porin family protein [Candidatus Omnitrophota bacterium]MCG2706175.1 porin family protein [Candidatus Omnitrophota bacterium]
MKKILALTICFMLIGVGNSFAQLREGQALELGAEVSQITYKEPGVMEEKGMMYGIVGSYTYRGCVYPSPPEIDRTMLRAEAKGSWGQVDYKNSGTLDNINDYILEFRGLGGYDFSVFTESTLTPYIGFGYRYLNDDMSGKITSTNAVGYERESNYIYSPIGVEVITPLKNDWSIGATAEYDIFWWGQQKSHLSDARLYSSTWGYYTYPDVENDQEKGYGIRGSIKLQKESEKLDFVIEPYIKYWNIKRSTEVTASTTSENGLWIITSTFVEPKNNSTEIGVKVAVKF